MLLTATDVQLLQECLTGRTIESQYVTKSDSLNCNIMLMFCSAILGSFSLVVKKHHGFGLGGIEIGFWDSKRQEIQATEFGAMQVWRVLDKEKLVGGVLLNISAHTDQLNRTPSTN